MRRQGTLLVFLLAACGEAPRLERISAPATGDVTGQVRSETGVRVARATLTLSSGTTVRRAETDAGGVYRFGTVVPAAWSLEITLPGGWNLSEGESAARIIVVRAHETAREDFVLVRAP